MRASANNTQLRLRPVANIALLGCALFLVACSIFDREPADPMNDLRDQVRLTVTDEARAEAMLAVVDKLEDKLVEMAVLVADTLSAERELFRNYDSERQQFEDLLGEAAEERQRLQRSLLDVHLEFKSYLNDDEWDVILPVHTQAVSAKTAALVETALEQRRL